MDDSTGHDRVAEPGSARWAVVESTIALASKLRLVTIAEGVETSTEWNNLGCELVKAFTSPSP